MIHVEGLTYTYPASDQPALRSIDLQVSRGEMLGVAGPNKAGKSTLLLALAGFIPHFYGGETIGSVRVGSRDLAGMRLEDLVGTVGLVFQDPFNQITGARFTVREEIGFGLENLGVARQEMNRRIEEILELMDLTEEADRSPYALSGGQQQRLALASVLVMEPEVLLLDEPTSQLDPAGTQELFRALKQLSDAREVTVVLTEHKLEWMVETVDRVALLEEGQISAIEAPRQVLGDPARLTHGVPRTQYTQAALLARRRGLLEREGPLPVTLDQAVEEFGGGP